MVHFQGQWLLAAAYGVTAVAAACSSNLLVDDFAKYSSNTNSLGSWTSDDGSMSSISGSGGVLNFTPKSGAYFYETFPCQALQTNAYTHIQFDIKSPASGASFDAIIQYGSSCSATTYTESTFKVTNLSGSMQTLRIPLSSFAGANLNTVTAIVFGGFSTNSQWQLDNIVFVCNGGGATTAPTTTTTPATPTSTPVATTTRVTTTTPVTPSTTATQPTTSPGTCSPLLIDDWASQSRLTFLFYNALLLPSSDDATMKSLVVANNRVTITPTNTNSYFYTQVGCLDATKYGGISLRIKAPAGTTFGLEIASKSSCSGSETARSFKTTADLGWTFDGTEKLYSIPWSKYPSGVDLTKVSTLLFRGFTKAVTFGPMEFYCGSTPSEWVLPTTTNQPVPTSTVPAPTATVAQTLVIDSFSNADTNALGFWHGTDEMTLTWGSNRVTLKSTDPDFSFYSQVSATCRDMRSYSGSYLHIAFTGHTKFTVALQQHNSQCNENIAPYPETWDSLEAGRYASGNNIYIPMSHFNVNLQRVIGIAIKSFYSTDTVVLTKIEIVPSIPSGVSIPSKLPSGNLMFACTRPNSFAFAIDDGDPIYAAKVMQMIRDAGIKVTFFTVGAPLEDSSTGLAGIYRQMKDAGHQIALHSYTHPKMEGLPDLQSIDWEYNKDVQAVSNTFNGLKSSYFRPPFGTEGARMRQRWAVASGSSNPYLINWSVDVEDWLWAESSTPQKQLDAFKRDLAKGGNLVVMHYLYNSTVNYLPEFIRLAKATGKQLMRVDQCMQDPNAPPL